MTYPSQQPHHAPYVPGTMPPNGDWRPRSQPLPPKRKGLGIAIAIAGGALLLIALGTVALLALRAIAMPPLATFDAQVTSCSGSGSVASVGFTIKNTGTTTRDATVKIEYRDGSGARLDTDTAYIRNVRPGDTVRSEESTFLDAAPPGALTCRITGIR
jgi:hypothetical protein